MIDTRHRPPGNMSGRHRGRLDAAVPCRDERNRTAPLQPCERRLANNGHTSSCSALHPTQLTLSGNHEPAAKPSSRPAFSLGSPGSAGTNSAARTRQSRKGVRKHALGPALRQSGNPAPTAPGSSGGASTMTNSSTPNSANAAPSAGRGSRSATASRSSPRSRPDSRHSSIAGRRRSATAATPSRLKPYQPSPQAATRRIAASLLPPSTTGMRRSRAGFGLTRIARSRRTPRRTMRRRRATGPASRRRTRRCAGRGAANGTPSASNSSRDQPIPTPSMSRPPLNRSRLGGLLGDEHRVVFGQQQHTGRDADVRVAAAAKLRQISGSSQSASAGTAIRPSSEYG